MDDRNNFPRNTDISAQRRHRRRASEEDERPESSYCRPVRPETEEAKTDFRKPIIPMPEEPKTEEDAEEKMTETGISNEDTRRLDLSETGAENTETKSDSMQRADSRVPAEARRMAAAPYGTGRPEHRRPGTRPMTAPPRPVVPGKTGQPERQNGRAMAKELRKQSAVGYAPGRMNEGFTRKIQAQADMREKTANDQYEYSGNREARAYLERRGQPFRDDAEEAPAVRRASSGLRLLVAVLLIAGAVLTALLVLKNRNGSDITKDANRVISFEETKPEGATVCTDVTYSVLTTNDVKEIRLIDQQGKAVPITVAGANNADGNAWVITLNMEEDFEGILRLQVCGEDGKWETTDLEAGSERCTGGIV